MCWASSTIESDVPAPFVFLDQGLMQAVDCLGDVLGDILDAELPTERF